MAAYDSLKSLVQQAIRTNGNNEITGQVLQNVLMAMIDELGGENGYAGVATPSTNPGAPDGKVFYFATEAGTYTHFDGATLAKGIHLLVFNGVTWSHQTLYTIDSEVTSGSNNLITSGAVYTKIINAINALDATVSKSAGADGLSLSLTETDGKVTSISGSIAPQTYDAYGAASAAQIAASTDATNKVNAAKTQILGDAASDYNTLGKLEDKIQAEASRAAATESALNTAKADKATTLAGYGINDAYTKTEVNGLVSTPHQNYVTVPTYASLPATGSADTIYRVSNYNGSTSQVDASVYSEYAWNGSGYTFLRVVSQIGEVFDITVYNSNTKYADLAAALGTNGANVPSSIRRGGMSVKFVQSSDNKYVQARCMAQNFTTDVTQWQGVDKNPIPESRNIPESDGVTRSLEKGGLLLSFDTVNKNRYISGSWKKDETICLSVKGMSAGNFNLNLVDSPVTYNVLFGQEDGIYYYKFTRDCERIRVGFTDPTGTETIEVNSGANVQEIEEISDALDAEVDARQKFESALQENWNTYNFTNENSHIIVNLNCKQGELLAFIVKGMAQQSGAFYIDTSADGITWNYNAFVTYLDGLYFYKFNSNVNYIRFNVYSSVRSESVSFNKRFSEYILETVKSTGLECTFKNENVNKIRPIYGNWKIGDTVCIKVSGMTNASGNWYITVNDGTEKVIKSTQNGTFYYNLENDATVLKIGVETPAGSEKITFQSGSMFNVENKSVVGSTKLVDSDGIFEGIFSNMYNVLSKYSLEKYYLKTDNTLSPSQNLYWNTYYKIPVKKGDIICYRKTLSSLDDTASYYIITDTAGNIIEQRNGTVHDTAFNYSYKMESDGYVSLCVRVSDGAIIGEVFIARSCTGMYELMDYSMKKEINSYMFNILSKSILEKYFLKTDNTLDSGPNNYWNTFYKVPVKKGDAIFYQKVSNLLDVASYYIITDKEGNVLTQRDGTGADDDFTLFYIMEEDGFASLCVRMDNGVILTDAFISRSCTGMYDLLDKNNVVQSPFRSIYKFGVIGDSLSVGYMTDPTTGIGIDRNIRFSWPQILARKNGCVSLNFGFHGATTSTWFTNTTYNCPALLSDPDNQCQAYIIGLGANGNNQTGSMSDIDWNDGDNNRDTFYGQYARIIQLIRSVSPKAPIFCLTLPYPRENNTYNNAIKEICKDSHISDHCFVVDLCRYNNWLKEDIVGDLVVAATADYSKFYYHWHFTAPGYAMCAELIEKAISDVMNNNSNSPVIQSIGQIPYGSNDVIN